MTPDDLNKVVDHVATAAMICTFTWFFLRTCFGGD